MKYQLRHTTRYCYSHSVTLSHNEARLLPRNLDWQHCTQTRLTINPAPQRQHERRDFFGNRVAYFAIQDIHDSLEVTAQSLVTTDARPTPEADACQMNWESAVEQLTPQTQVSKNNDADCQEARLFNLDSPFVRHSLELKQFALESFTEKRPLLAAILDFNQRIFNDFQYDPGFSTLATPVAEVLQQKKGVCQDFAHLVIGALRSIGLPARYVSGYLETLPPPGQQKRIGADASHAWLSVFIPGWGWLDIDPTNGSLPDDRYLTLGWGRDYGDVTPLKGVMNGGGAHELEVEVDVVAVG